MGKGRVVHMAIYLYTFSEEWQVHPVQAHL